MKLRIRENTVVREIELPDNTQCYLNRNNYYLVSKNLNAVDADRIRENFKQSSLVENTDWFWCVGGVYLNMKMFYHAFVEII